jgi:hypothetical protein
MEVEVGQMCRENPLYAAGCIRGFVTINGKKISCNGEPHIFRPTLSKAEEDAYLKRYHEECAKDEAKSAGNVAMM